MSTNWLKLVVASFYCIYIFFFMRGVVRVVRTTNANRIFFNNNNNNFSFLCFK